MNPSHVSPPGITRKKYAEIRRILAKPHAEVTPEDWQALSSYLRLWIVKLENWWYRNEG